MSPKRFSPRNSCKRGNLTKKNARKKSKDQRDKNQEPDHQPFMAISRNSFFRIGKGMVCEKRAIAFARSAREEDVGERKRKGAKKSTITIGVVKGGKCVFAEGPNAKHFLSQPEFKFRA